MAEDDVVEDGLRDSERVKDLSVDVGALHAQRRRRTVGLPAGDTRVQRLRRDCLRLLRSLHASGDWKIIKF